MMPTERRGPRIAPKDFRDFTVQLHHGEDVALGHLGNISESGLCIMLPVGTEFPPERTPVEGYVLSRRMKETLEFSGRIAWKATGRVDGRDTMLAGVQFGGNLDLPDTLLALSISADQS